MKTFLHEFKTFAMRGNVIDLAVAVVLGAAFGKIVSSLVDDVVMPLVGGLTGGVDLGGLSFIVADEVIIRYGLFLNTIITFVIIAFAIFSVVKLMNTLQKKEEEEPTEAKKSNEEELLIEIRDLLKKQ
jgi:large conductance mechanosensitive channel